MHKHLSISTAKTKTSPCGRCLDQKQHSVSYLVICWLRILTASILRNCWVLVEQFVERRSAMEKQSQIFSSTGRNQNRDEVTIRTVPLARSSQRSSRLESQQQRDFTPLQRASDDQLNSEDKIHRRPSKLVTDKSKMLINHSTFNGFSLALECFGKDE